MRYERIAIFLLLLYCVPGCTTTNPPKKTAETPAAVPETSSIAPAIERDVLYYVNKHRESKGLAPLSFNAIVASEARRHSTNMASKRVAFGHDGLTARTRNITARIKSVHAVSENVARGTLTAQQVVNLWLKSEGHRRNIEGNYKYTGIGVARARNSELYFTGIFAN